MLACAPLLGSALFLAVSLPLTAEYILHLEHYGAKSAAEAFQPWVGAVYSARSIVDNLTLGALGLSAVELPIGLVPVALAALVLLGIWWWRPVPHRRLLPLGLGLILLNYLLIYSARAEWDYAQMTMSNWSRYHLLPQLGLALLVCGGLPRFQDRLDLRGPAATLSRRQARLLGGLVAALFVIQLPHALLVPRANDPEQREVLRRIQDTDAVCQAHHIAADQARAVLPFLRVPLCAKSENGWNLLRGSHDPRPMPLDEVRRLVWPSGAPSGARD
jgi:hypothetical protein